MRQTIQICRARDGTRIAWASVGSGPPLVKAANWLNHLEFDWESPVWRHTFRALARDFTLIRYDERGNGLSDWNVAELSLEAFVQDLETVVDAAGLERFSLFGVSQGCAASIAYAVRHPERVARLVLYGGFAAGWAHGSETARAREEAMITLTEHGWGQDNPAYRQLFASLFVPDADEDCRRWFNELQRVSTSPANAVRLQRAIGELDVRALLPQVAAPTLVFHVRDDAMVPFRNGRSLAAAIPGARFVPLPGRNHLLLEHEPGWERFLVELRAFLAGDEDGGERADDDDANTFGARLVTGGALAGALGADLACGLDRPSPGAEPSSLPSGLAPGATLAKRYRIVARLGGGGMGIVLRARDSVLDRDVAIKAIVSTTPGGSWRERVLREARAAAALNHPHIAAIHDVGEENGAPYLVMELVGGPDLAESPPATIDEAVAIAIQVCDALAHAHGRGIVHRDLKPANILRSEGDARPEVKLVDLGIALVNGHDRLTATGLLLGTPSYLSPEQAKGATADARSDLYALGAMLYEWIVGEPPFVAGDAMAVVAQHVHAAPAPPSERRRELPAALETLILRLLAKDPVARPASAAEVRDTLAGLLESLSSSAALAPESSPSGSPRSA